MKKVLLVLLAAALLGSLVSCAPAGSSSSAVESVIPRASSAPQTSSLAPSKPGVVGLSFDYASIFVDGIAVAGNFDESGSMKMGLIDKEGNAVVPFVYYDIGYFTEGIAVARKEEEGKFGCIDETGKEIVPFEYDLIYPFSNGLAAVRNNIDGEDLYGYVDKQGKLALPFLYGYATAFDDNGFAVVRKKDEDEKILINKQGEEISGFRYTDIMPLGKGFYWVTNDSQNGPSKYFLVDKNGAKIPDFDYNPYYGGSFSEGLAAVKKDDKCGYVDTSLQEAIPCTYDEARDFRDGLAAVRVGSQWGFLDPDGKEVIAPQYDACYSFRDGMAAVQKDKKWGFIDKTGKVVIPLIYEDKNREDEVIIGSGEGLALIQEYGKYTYLAPES